MRQTKTGHNSGQTKIIVEHVYVGDRKMEEVFGPINEAVTRKNIEEKIKVKKEA